MKVKVKSLSHVRLFVTPWTIVLQVPLSMEFFRQEYWSELPFPTPGITPLHRYQLIWSLRSTRRAINQSIKLVQWSPNKNSEFDGLGELSLLATSCILTPIRAVKVMCLDYPRRRHQKLHIWYNQDVLPPPPTAPPPSMSALC